MRRDVLVRPHALSERSELYRQPLVGERPRHSRRQMLGERSAVAVPGVSHELAISNIPIRSLSPASKAACKEYVSA